MNTLRQSISVALVIMLVGLGFTAQAQRRAYRLSDSQVEQIIRRVETRADRFRTSLDAALDRSRLDGTSTEDDINNYIRAFENATDTLRERFNERRSVSADVQAVLTQAANIDGFVRANRLTTRTQTDWTLLKTDLNALANAYGISGRWDVQSYPSTGSSQYPSGLNNRRVEQIIRRLETDTDRFRTSLSAALDTTRMDGTRREDRINDLVRDFDAATDQLRTRFNSRTSVAADVQNVLDRALPINNFMNRRRLNARAETDWATVRSGLDALAGAYNLTARWDNNSTFPSTGGNYGNSDQRLTGTYQLDVSRSDNARDVADRATRSLPYNERQRINDALLARLEAPDTLAIERRGSSVTIASTRAPQTTFVADGVERTEQLPNGRTARVRTSLSGDQLVVSSTGQRASDFTVTFEPMDNGRTLRVTRSIFSDRFNQPIVVQNTYNRTSDVAQFNVYNGTTGYSQTGSGSTTASGDFVVRNGETLVAVLDTDVSTQRSQEGDRFRMTVRSPSQYDGAVIEGRITDVSRSGRISGRSGLTFNFDTIRLRNGQSYRFAGFVDTVRTASGETVRVDNEGTVQDSNQTERTVQRAAIGTAVGAIIGAIAGGGKGAAIGAILGAGAGAGSVYVQGRDDLELLSGSEVTIRASSPDNR